MTSSRRELVDEILGRHLGAEGGELISATTVARCASYPFALWCDLFAPEDERDADSEFLVMRREAGHAHELKMIEGEVVPVPSQTLEEGFRHTVELMAAGEAKIFQGPLISRPSGMAGIPDQLVKMARSRSIFGNYRYRVVEVKSQYNLTAAHRVQAAFYSRLLGAIQASAPKTFALVDGHGQESVEKFDSWADSLERYIEIARSIVSGQCRPRPVFGRTPEPWLTFGDRLAEGGLTRLQQIGTPREEALMAAGYYTIQDIAQASRTDLARVPKLNSLVADQIVAQATAILADAPSPRSPVRLPRADTEIFLDMENINEGFDVLEGTQAGFTNYLIGMLVRSGPEEQYIPFFAETREDEGMCWQEFCTLVASVHSAVIYYWSASAEPVYIRKMIARYETSPSAQNRLRSAVDLYRCATQAFSFPTKSYGLKDIAGHLGFTWHDASYDGLSAMMDYGKYLKSGSTKTTIRNKLLRYNGDDCRALMAVKDWLVANSI